MRRNKKPDKRKIMNELLNIPYALGRWDKGLDCIALPIQFMEKCGQNILKEYKGYTPDNYSSLYKENKKLAISIMIEFILSITNKVSGKLQHGDILVLKPKNGLDVQMFCGIYAGRQNIMSSAPKYGTIISPLNNYVICYHRRMKNS